MCKLPCHAHVQVLHTNMKMFLVNNRGTSIWCNLGPNREAIFLSKEGSKISNYLGPGVHKVLYRLI
jgi:hypothetical protein